jgi:hypothetical protein
MPPSRSLVASPLLRRLPPNATQEQVARAYADALLFVLQTWPEELERLKARNDEMQAVVVVADAVSQRAEASAQRLEGTQHELRGMQDVLRSQLERVQLAIGHLERVSSVPPAPASAPIEHLRDVVKDAVEEAVEDAVEEVTGRHEMPSERVREIARSMTNEDKLLALAATRDFRLKIAAQVIGGVILLVVAYLFGRMTGGH